MEEKDRQLQRVREEQRAAAQVGPRCAGRRARAMGGGLWLVFPWEKDETCPLSTGGRTRRVQLVRGGSVRSRGAGAGGERPEAAGDRGAGCGGAARAGGGGGAERARL